MTAALPVSSSRRSGEDAAFGREVRWLRESRGLGLRQLARRASLSASYLSRLENGRVSPPSGGAIARLARALDTDGDALLVAAGRLPEHVLDTIRRRPVVLLLLRALSPLSDHEIELWVNSIRRAPSSTSR